MTHVVDSGAGATFDIAVRWGDLDAMNHVNNTVYFRYIEEARVQLMMKLGMVPPSPRTGVLAHASLDFLRSILSPDTVGIVNKLLMVGGRRIELEVLVGDANQADVIYARGRCVLVSINPQGGSQPWTEDERKQIHSVFQG